MEIGNKVRFLGDVHGNFAKYAEDIKCDHTTIQVGDFGLGFEEPPPMAEKDLWIRGNHDDPALSRAHPNYIGDIAVIDKMFFMSGARSIDQDQRMIGRDWWPDEELSHRGLMAAIDIYEQVKPRIVVTHDCPESIAKVVFRNRESRRSSTASALDTMFEIHKPDFWLFGHWHTNIRQVIFGTRFICVANNDMIDINFSS